MTGGKHQSSGVPACADYSLLLKPGKHRASWTQKDKLHPPPGYPSSPYLQNLVSDQLARETCPVVLGGQSGWTDRQWPSPTLETRQAKPLPSLILHSPWVSSCFPCVTQPLLGGILGLEMSAFLICHFCPKSNILFCHTVNCPSGAQILKLILFITVF